MEDSIKAFALVIAEIMLLMFVVYVAYQSGYDNGVRDSKPKDEDEAPRLPESPWVNGGRK